MREMGHLKKTEIVLKIYLKKKETEMQKEIIKVVKHASDCRNKAGKYKIGVMNLLTSAFYLLARLTLIFVHIPFQFLFLLVVFKNLNFRRKI